MDLLDELDRLIRGENASVAGGGADSIPLDALLRRPLPSNASSSSSRVGDEFVRSLPVVVVLLVTYSIIIVLSLFGNSLVRTRLQRLPQNRGRDR